MSENTERLKKEIGLILHCEPVELPLQEHRFFVRQIPLPLHTCGDVETIPKQLVTSV